MIVMTEHHLVFLSLKGGYTQARMSQNLSKCQIVGNLMLRLKCFHMRSSVVKCMTRDQGVAGLSLTGDAALCP